MSHTTPAGARVETVGRVGFGVRGVAAPLWARRAAVSLTLGRMISRGTYMAALHSPAGEHETQALRKRVAAVYYASRRMVSLRAAAACGGAMELHDLAGATQRLSEAVRGMGATFPALSAVADGLESRGARHFLAAKLMADTERMEAKRSRYTLESALLLTQEAR